MANTGYYDEQKILNRSFDDLDNMIKVKSMQSKWRDTFAGTSLDTTNTWDVVVGTGMTNTVSGGVLTQASGTTASQTTTLTSKQMFTIPFKSMFALYLSAMPTAGQTNQIYIEFVSCDPTTGVLDGKSSCGFLIDNGCISTQSKYYVQAGGAAALVSGASAMVNPITAYTILELEPFADECYFHSRQMDSTAGRQASFVRHQQLPDPNAFYKMRLRFVNGATPAAITTYFQYVLVNDYAELTAEITAGRGNIVQGQAIAAQIVNTVALPISGTVTAIPSPNQAYYQDSITPLTANALFTGTPRDTGTTTSGYSRIRIGVTHVAGADLGHLILEQSHDGTTYVLTDKAPIPSEAGSGTPATSPARNFDFVATMRFVRISFLNGPTAQTVFRLQSEMIRSDGEDPISSVDFLHTNTNLVAAGVYKLNSFFMDLGPNKNYAYYRVFVVSDQPGTLAIEVSKDGVDANARTLVSTPVVANTPIMLESKVPGRYVRPKFTNSGAATQTLMELYGTLSRM